MSALTLAAVATACGNSNDDAPVVTATPSPTPSSTPTPTPSATPTPTPTPTPTGPKSEITKGVETFLRSSIPATLTGVEPNAIACPPDLTLEAGKTFDCDVTIPQGKFKANVVMKDDKGQLAWVSKGLIPLAPLEQRIKDAVKEREQVDATVDCGSAQSPVYLFEQVGETIECSVTTPDGKQRKAIITIENEVGRVNLKFSS